MPIPNSDFDDVSVMVDPVKGRISLICPAPIIGFNNVSDFKEFVSMLESRIPALVGRIGTENYTGKELDGWQEEIKTIMPSAFLPSAPKGRGPKKSNDKPSSSA